MIDTSDFTDEVIKLANEVFLEQVLNQGINSIPEVKKVNKNKSIKSYNDLIVKSEKIIKKQKIKTKLCEALKSTSKDLTEIAKIVAAVLIPLALADKPIIQLNSYIFAGISVVIFNAGVNSICSEKNENKQ